MPNALYFFSYQTMPNAFAVFSYVALCVLVATFARAYERSPVGWFILSLLFTPVASFVFLIVAGVPARAVMEKAGSLRSQYPEEKHGGRVALGETSCPQCGAKVNAETGHGLHSPEKEPWLLICNQCQAEIEPSK